MLRNRLTRAGRWMAVLALLLLALAVHGYGASSWPHEGQVFVNGHWTAPAPPRPAPKARPPAPVPPAQQIAKLGTQLSYLTCAVNDAVYDSRDYWVTSPAYQTAKAQIKSAQAALAVAQRDLNVGNKPAGLVQIGSARIIVTAVAKSGIANDDNAGC